MAVTGSVYVLCIVYILTSNSQHHPGGGGKQDFFNFLGFGLNVVVVVEVVGGVVVVVDVVAGVVVVVDVVVEVVEEGAQTCSDS